MKVVVSGAAGVLGQAVCAALIDQGATVARIARKRTDTAQAGDLWFPCENLADEVAAKAAADRAIAAMGGIDALVHVAGAFD